MEEKNYKLEIFNGVFFVIGVLLLAFCYNLFLLPNDFVIAGLSGVSLVVHKLTGLNPTIFIYISSFILIVISFIFLGFEKTKYTIIGSILYPLMITFTAPFVVYLIDYVSFSDTILTVLFAGVLFGIGSGLVYKCGFTTGGNDVLMQIMNKHFKISETKALMFMNVIVIGFGVAIFGFEKGVYSIIIMFISSLLIDKIIYGISESKLFYVFSKDARKLKKAIFEEFETGYTILPTKGGYSHTNGNLIMVVVTNRDYYKFKTKILELDPKAFFIISDCYEVNGGVKRSNLPFI
ncbi:MAG: YitT family protein [Bacilli bacterium]